MNAVDINLYSVARSMLLYGARFNIVKSETGLTVAQLNHIYRDVLGDKPKSRGAFSYSAKRFLRDRNKLRDALLFALFYRLALKGDRSGFPTLAAYGMYRKFRPQGAFDYTDAFVTARLLMDGQVFVEYCGCGTATLRLANEDVARCFVCDSRMPGDA
jgi:hypothetical protein